MIELTVRGGLQLVVLDELEGTVNVGEGQDVLKADALLIAQVDLVEHVKVAGNLNLFGRDLAELLVGEGDLDGVIHVEPGGHDVDLGAVLVVAEHEVACLFEVVELELLLHCAFAFSLKIAKAFKFRLD